jgi:hypothetical protein
VEATATESAVVAAGGAWLCPLTVAIAMNHDNAIAEYFIETPPALKLDLQPARKKLLKGKPLCSRFDP